MPPSKARKAPPAVNAENEASTSGGDKEPGRIMYIGHVPHGFYEGQMKAYFSQFGKVTRVRLSRSKKTGKSKHYAFVEFYSPEVAKIAAEAMDGYMFFGQKLQARVMLQSQVHKDLMKGANRVFKKVPWKKVEADRQGKERTDAEEKKVVARALRRDKARQKKIQEAGIEYEYEGLQTKLAPKPKKTVFEN